MRLVSTEVLRTLVTNPAVFVPGSDVPMASEISVIAQNLQPKCCGKNKRASLGPAGNAKYKGCSGSNASYFLTSACDVIDGCW